MRCEDCRDALSARLDGEDLPPGADDALVDAHLASCAACTSWSTAVATQHRELRVRAAEPVPDLTASILAAVPPALRPHPVREWVRYALLAIALTQLVIALPALLLGEDTGASIHVAREIGSFDIALAVGLLWAAWQPRRAAGLLPMAVALAGTTVLASVLDIARHVAPAFGEAHHVLDLAGVGLLLLLVRRPARQRPLRGSGIVPA